MKKNSWWSGFAAGITLGLLLTGAGVVVAQIEPAPVLHAVTVQGGELEDGTFLEVRNCEVSILRDRSDPADEWNPDLLLPPRIDRPRGADL